MSRRGEVLVAIMNQPLDFVIARDQHWYRIPVTSAEKWLRSCWPPGWLAFYQTKVFGDEAYAVNYYARVLDIRKVFRWELFPEEPHTGKGIRQYFKLSLSPLERMARPIVSRRLRRIVFIPTTWQKFVMAEEMNDLWDESPLEDQLWTEFKRLSINAERQERVRVTGRSYRLDFALYCASGKIDVETDGDSWHADPERIPLDNLRDNDLETHGWRVLRFNTLQIREQMARYCLPTVTQMVDKLGGLNGDRLVPRRVGAERLGGWRQPSLFEPGPADASE
jgi:very-short-patch-repair endonuclease